MTFEAGEPALLQFEIAGVPVQVVPSQAMASASSKNWHTQQGCPSRCATGYYSSSRYSRSSSPSLTATLTPSTNR